MRCNVKSLISNIAKKFELHVNDTNNDSRLLNNINVYNTLSADGFRLSDYVNDWGIESIYCYIDSDEWNHISAVVASINNDAGMLKRIEGWVSDSAKSLAFPREVWLGRLHTKNLEDIKTTLKPGKRVLILGNESEELLQVIKESGLIVWKFNHFVTSALNYHCFNKYLIKKYRETPNMTVICCTLPQFPTGTLSSNEQRILNEGIHATKVLHRLMRGESLLNTTLAYSDTLYSKEDVISMLSIPPSSIDRSGRLRFEDYSSCHVNSEGGRRVNPIKAIGSKRKMYIFGGCRTMGYGSPDNKTPAAFLQEILNKNEIEIEVQNWAYLLSRRYRLAGKIIESMPILPGDFLLITNGYIKAELKRFNIDYIDIDLSKALNRPHNYGETIIDKSLHYTEGGNRAIADGIFSTLNKLKLLHESDYEQKRSAFFKARKNSLARIYADEEIPFGAPFFDFLNSLEKERVRVGSIVMNCNPFTLGHRYLIEHASLQVDHLYIFVVEEDRSFFKFEDRFKLVKNGVSDLRNVSVIPSGKFIISSITFSDYFGKADLQDKTIDPSGDVELFAKYIAPRLNISVRFAGEEPLDQITKQYNDAMARILPEYGIEFCVIDRKEHDKSVISASRVRKLLETNNWREISKLVPSTTLDFLKHEWQQCREFIV